MQRSLYSGLALLATLTTSAAAQTHVTKKPETVVRAVAVYEYTGEPAKVIASRLVPVSIYINAELEDAGVYKAAPVPFTLGTGTVFELERSGAPEGTLEIAYQRHLKSNGDIQFDDGWLGYGAFKPAPRPDLVAGVQRGPLPQVMVDGKPVAGAPAGTATARQPVDRSTAATGKVAITGGDDDDTEPVLGHKNVDAPAASTSTQDSSVDPSDKSDRPTLKKRDDATSTNTQKKPRRQGDVASVRSVGSLNDDPDRPMLHRGAPAGRLDEDSLPPLNGLPADMKQLVAVSDARNRPEHEFARSWDSDAERAEVLTTLEDAARARLARYDSLTGLSINAAAPPAKPAAKPATAAARHKAAQKPAPAPLPLTGEQLKSYTLSYGGSPTFVFTASAPGAKGVTQYVTVVAQRDGTSTLKLAMTSVTDSSHLDRTPWMRLIDAVDAEASNRASLLFELRAQHTRQFALYRVIGAQAEQTLATGSNP